MYTKILPPNMAHCQTPKLKYRVYLVNVVALTNLIKTTILVAG